MLSRTLNSSVVPGMPMRPKEMTGPVDAPPYPPQHPAQDARWPPRTEDAHQASGHGSRGGTAPGLADPLIIVRVPARERHGGMVPEHQQVVEAELAVVVRPNESRNLLGMQRQTVSHPLRVGVPKIVRMQQIVRMQHQISPRLWRNDLRGWLLRGAGLPAGPESATARVPQPARQPVISWSSCARFSFRGAAADRVGPASRFPRACAADWQPVAKVNQLNDQLVVDRPPVTLTPPSVVVT